LKFKSQKTNRNIFGDKSGKKFKKMQRNIPLKLNKNDRAKSKEENSKSIEKKVKSRISPYDIILGKIEMNYEKIPEFM
jgi:hypothetical protein